MEIFNELENFDVDNINTMDFFDLTEEYPEDTEETGVPIIVEQRR